MRILIAASEAVPFIKTGGLGDVVGALMREYRKMNAEASVMLPLYRKIREAAKDFGIRPSGKKITVPIGNTLETGEIWEGQTPDGGRAYFIENSKFYDRDELYGTPRGDYPDNFHRFVFYNRAVLESLKALKLNVDIIHCNDWQTGLIPVYIKTIYRNDFPETATLITIHNLGYQGLFPSPNMSLTGFGQELFNIDGMEFYGKINFLKGGLFFADIINTVSDNYAKEILTTEYGFGLDGVLRKRSAALYGIINGIDYDDWNPGKDKMIPANYSPENMSGKALCKKSLLKSNRLTMERAMLIGMVTRLSSQKGLDLVADAMGEIIKSGIRVIILGTGEETYHKVFTELEKKHRGKLSISISFDDSLAHRIYAGSDLFLMPSRYEPCGLGQLIAMRYGAIPVVRKTGGLADTVEDYTGTTPVLNESTGLGTGFSFSGYSSRNLFDAIKKAHKVFTDKKKWADLQKNAMSQDFSWRRSAEKYLCLYEKALKQKDK